MNVLQVLPHFLLGVVLALLVLKTRSVYSSMVFRLVWETLLWGPLLSGRLSELLQWASKLPFTTPFGGMTLALLCLILSLPLLLTFRSVFRREQRPFSAGG